jgi:hypothetical protein
VGDNYFQLREGSGYPVDRCRISMFDILPNAAATTGAVSAI